jgi:hypothetical protein
MAVSAAPRYNRLFDTVPVITGGSHERSKGFLALFGLAALFTFLNCLKPLHVDDACYYSYAAHIAEHPLDPYGFEINWNQWPASANQVLAPPVFLYWWALGISLLGQDPLLWKLWMLPIALLLAYSLRQLFQRFAPGVQTPLLWLTMMSPALLPSFNLMLDVPVLALGLFSLTVFFRACEEDSIFRVSLAGLLAGLAMQTKYNALLAPPVMVLYGMVQRKARWGLCAACLAGFVFIAWEGYVAVRYGQSHFLVNLRTASATHWNKYWLLCRGLVNQAGGLGAPITLLALTAIGISRARIIATALAVVIGYVLIACVPETMVTLIAKPGSANPIITLNQVSYGVFGCFLIGTVVMVIGRLRRGQGRGDASLPWGGRRPDRFLMLWLFVELVGYFLISPFPAARRLQDLMVVITLIVGRLAAQTCRSRQRRTLVHAVTVFGIALGLLYYAVDLCEAYAPKRAMAAAQRHVRVQAPEAGPTIWYTGHWGFQFYAEQAGMRSLLPDQSLLHRGDWLVIPDGRFSQQHFQADSAPLEFAATIDIDDCVPWRSVMCFYLGCVPLEHHEGPRASVTIFRVTSDFVPVTRP